MVQLRSEEPPRGTHATRPMALSPFPVFYIVRARDLSILARRCALVESYGLADNRRLRRS